MRLTLWVALLVSATVVEPRQQLRHFVDSADVPQLQWRYFQNLQPDVARFYERTGYQAAWLRDGAPTPQGQQLIGILQNAALKGLDANDYDAWRLSPRQIGPEAFDVALTVSALRYIHDVSSGKVNPDVFSFGLHFSEPKIDPAVLLSKLVNARDIAAELDRLEPPFPGYCRLENALQQYLMLARDNSDPSRSKALALQVRKLQLTLERWRWVPHSFPRPPIVVNIPEFRLRAYDDQYRAELEMKVVVGKAYHHKTPVFSNEMTHVIFRPYWDVPISIVRAELIPKLEQEPDYLIKNDFEIVDSRRQLVSVDTITPEIVGQLQRGDLSIRQRPGEKNALGFIKFLFPNEYNVYLHGTPAKALFQKSRRDFSHGCIRVEKPEELAAWVLRGVPGWDMDHIRAAEAGSDSRQVNLDKAIPVLIVYGTAVVRENGEVSFFDDIYGYDAELARLLDHGYPYSGWRQ